MIKILIILLLFGCKISSNKKIPQTQELSLYTLVQPSNSLLCFTNAKKNTKNVVIVPQKKVKEKLKREGVTTLVGEPSRSWGYWWGPGLVSYYVKNKKKSKERLLQVLGYKKDEKLEWSGEDAIQEQSNAFYVRPALREHLLDVCLEEIKERYPDANFALHEMRARNSILKKSGYPIVTIIEDPKNSRYVVKRIYRLENPYDIVKLNYKKLIEIAKIAHDPYLLEAPEDTPYKVEETPNFIRLIDYKKKLYASSFYDKSNNILYLSYKGSSNLNDIKADVTLMTGTYVHKILFFKQRLLGKKSTLEIYLEQAKELYYLAKEKFISQGGVPKNTKVIFTGHSLGGFVAAISSYDILKIDQEFKDMIAVVFSAPAPFKANNISDLITPKKRTKVYNFYRDKDPVARLSGRHPESTFVFNADENFEKFGSHFLKNTIEMFQNLEQGTGESFLKEVKISCQAKVEPDLFELQKQTSLGEICF
jgi:hypothetical protein